MVVMSMSMSMTMISGNRYSLFRPAARCFIPTSIILFLNSKATAYIYHGSNRHRRYNNSLIINSVGGSTTRNNYHNYLRHATVLFPSFSKTSSKNSPFALSTYSSDSSSINNGPSSIRSRKPLPYQSSTDNYKLQLLSFYHFVPIFEPETTRDVLFEKLETIEGLRGTVYIAKEGINAQFAVPVGNPLERLLEIFGEGGCLPFNAFQSHPPNLGDIVGSDTPTFDKLIVRTRDYILRDGMQVNGEDSTLDWSDTGIELDPSEWDEQLRQPSIQLLDCRNDYESELGSFVAAKPLNTKTFSDTWSILDSNVQSQLINPTEPVYIFCTGGIRCVKVGAYLRQRLGVEDVRSLKHGIIGYERWNKNENNNDESLWVGKNFLFDKRRFAQDDDETDSPIQPE